MRLGVISDTHGFLQPKITQTFSGVEAILHAGDIGSQAVLDALAAIAPLYAVQGNNDLKFEGFGLPLNLDIEIAATRIHLVHQLPQARPLETTRVIVYGHSHRAECRRTASGIVLLNPGAAGRVGFHTVQTVALLDLTDGSITAEIVELGPRRLGD